MEMAPEHQAPRVIQISYKAEPSTYLTGSGIRQPKANQSEPRRRRGNGRELVRSKGRPRGGQGEAKGGHGEATDPTHRAAHHHHHHHGPQTQTQTADRRPQTAAHFSSLLCARL
ncbi:hypothetical protein N431DRAFT_43101 [Stipitochalara longipes BDJ]|nr:hypothetical protein N431DRAFT_43101 [Stipitochalara longipes BDJ]